LYSSPFGSITFNQTQHRGLIRLCSIAAILWVGVSLAAGPRAAQASPRHIILCGSGGDKTYQEKFAAWGRRLRTALVELLGRPPDEIVLLTESADAATTPARISDLETIRSVFKEDADEVGPDDDLFIYLIGHGSHWRGVSRFHIPGPDLTADDLARLIEPVRARRLVLINAASAGAGFINTLSRSGRVIATATKSVAERNATEFMEYFLQALEDGSADQNRDERISVLEACRQAAALTDAYYVGRGLIATEHALLDDNGDGQGARLAGESQSDSASETSPTVTAVQQDGALAAQCFLKDFSFPPAVPREAVDRYLSLLKRIEELKSAKPKMESEAYYAALEPLIVKAARAHREIRRAGTR